MYAPLRFLLRLGMSKSAPRPSHQALRILLADDHAFIRKQVRMMLERFPRFEVIGEVQDGAEAVEQAVRLQPDIVILNVSMPVLNGLDAAREIKSRIPGSAIVMLSSHADRHIVDLAKQHGACAYISKIKAGEGLVKALEAAVLGEEFVLLD